ncbi:ion channel [Streptomyces sp. NPDC057298]|uniref:ion channel n=1 Tax=Streptomyces sp. NPDC057298 TaxID=3346091 RepID=UPI00362B2E35
MAISVIVLVTLYFLLPLERSSAGTAITTLVVGLVVFVALVAFQVRSVLRSPFAGLRAVEALTISVPFFLLLFAGTYVVMAKMSEGSFGVPLSHTEGLYFAVTVFATVGFGDLTAKSEAARLVVTGQMIADLVILGLAIKVTAGAVSRSRRPGDAPGA